MSPHRSCGPGTVAVHRWTTEWQIGFVCASHSRTRRHPRRIEHSQQHRRPCPRIRPCHDCGCGVSATGQRVLGEVERRYRRRLGAVGGLRDACEMTRQLAVALRPGTCAVVASCRIRREGTLGVVRPGVERSSNGRPNSTSRPVGSNVSTPMMCPNPTDSVSLHLFELDTKSCTESLDWVSFEAADS